MALPKKKTKPQRTLREESKVTDKEVTLAQAFWKGFFLPLKLVWKGLVWLSKKPPLKQIGKGLKWFFGLKPIKFIGRIIGLRYIRDSFKELRQVTWPTFKDSVRLTGAVIAFAIVFGLFIAGVDYVLDKLFREFLLR